MGSGYREAGRTMLRLSEMSWTAVRDAVREGFTTAVAAVGSTEQHGPHLPLGTDSLIGDILAERVAGGIGYALAAPTLMVGASGHHMAFPGTISMSEDLLVEVLLQYCASLAHHGLSTVALFPSHAGNAVAIARVVERAAHELPDSRVVGLCDLAGYLRPWYELGASEGLSAAAIGPHAGEAETSILLFLRPDLVQGHSLQTGYMGDLDEALARVFAEGDGVERLSASGVFGDPASSDADRGERYLEAMTRALVASLRAALSSKAGDCTSA